MLYRETTEEGSIMLYRSVIRTLISDVMDGFGGKVQFAGQHKGKFSNLVMRLGGVEDGNSVEINPGETGLVIRVYVVIRFGVSISRITDQLIDAIRASVQEHTGLSVESTTVMVAGLLSKQFVKRDIEVKK